MKDKKKVSLTDLKREILTVIAQHNQPAVAQKITIQDIDEFFSSFDQQVYITQSELADLYSLDTPNCSFNQMKIGSATEIAFDVVFNKTAKLEVIQNTHSVEGSKMTKKEPTVPLGALERKTQDMMLEEYAGFFTKNTVQKSVTSFFNIARKSGINNCSMDNLLDCHNNSDTTKTITSYIYQAAQDSFMDISSTLGKHTGKKGELGVVNHDGSVRGR